MNNCAVQLVYSFDASSPSSNLGDKTLGCRQIKLQSAGHGRSHVSKMRVSIFPSCPYKRPTMFSGQRRRGDRNGEGIPSPQPTAVSMAERRKPTSGRGLHGAEPQSQMILGRFVCDFTHLLVHLTAAYRNGRFLHPFTG